MGIKTRGGRKILMAATGVVLVGAAVSVFALVRRNDEAKLPEEFTLDALQAASEDRAAMRQRIHDAFRREDLTQAQRTQLHRNIQQVMGARMNRQFDEYFAAEASARQAILDRHLDEMQARMLQRQQRGDRTATERVGRRPRGPGADGHGSVASEARGEQSGGPGDHFGHRRDGSWTREQRKQHSESHNPDTRARRMAYFTALRQRAEARGIELHFRRGMGPPGRPR